MKTAKAEKRKDKDEENVAGKVKEMGPGRKKGKAPEKASKEHAFEVPEVPVEDLEAGADPGEPAVESLLSEDDGSNKAESTKVTATPKAKAKGKAAKAKATPKGKAKQRKEKPRQQRKEKRRRRPRGRQKQRPKQREKERSRKMKRWKRMVKVRRTRLKMRRRKMQVQLLRIRMRSMIMKRRLQRQPLRAEGVGEDGLEVGGVAQAGLAVEEVVAGACSWRMVVAKARKKPAALLADPAPRRSQPPRAGMQSQAASSGRSPQS